MKKSIRAVLLVFLSMVLMFGSAASVWGEWGTTLTTNYRKHDLDYNFMVGNAQLYMKGHDFESLWNKLITLMILR